MSLIPRDLPSESPRSLASVGLERPLPPVRRTQDGHIDFEHYLVRSRQLRAEAYGTALRGLARTIRTAASCVLAAFREWRARRRAINELLTLDDRTLRDLGLSRTGVVYVVDHGREDVPAPANANTRKGAAPRAA